jgi:hypothetical protein
MGGPHDEIVREGIVAAGRHGVRFLDRDTTEVGGVVFAGATLWEPDNSLYRASAMALQVARADIIVTHFPPQPEIILPALAAGGVWIYGHHHGCSDRTLAGRRLIRNALGYGGAETLIDSEPARPDFVLEIGP